MDLARRRSTSNWLTFGASVLIVISACSIFSVPVFFPETTCGALGGLLDCEGTLSCATHARAAGGRNYMNLRPECDGRPVSAAPIFFVTGGIGAVGVLFGLVAMLVAVRVRPRRREYAASFEVAVVTPRRPLGPNRRS